MKSFLTFFAFLSFTSTVWGQNEQLAKMYFDRGEFEKALQSYDELYKSQPGNTPYFQRLIECHQQLEQYDAAEALLVDRLKRIKQPGMLVELGYNYQLKKDLVNAEKYYTEAMDDVRVRPSNVYSVATVFERKVLLDKALEAYELAVSLDPKSRYNYQMGLLYGQLGKPDKMIEKFLDEVYENPQNNIQIQNQFSRFLSNDPDEIFAPQLRKALLVRAQKSQEIFWNQMLSWFFVQQKDFGKAFVQEKAIYIREPNNFENIVNLAQMALEEKEDDTATEILEFILENTQDLDLQIQAHYYLTDVRLNQSFPKEYAALESHLNTLLKQYGISPYTLTLQQLQARFYAFYLNNPEQGKTILQKALQMPLNKFQEAEVKMDLADILLFQEKYHQALVYYTQIEEDLKNDTMGHEASLKAAQTSYYKADFEWALAQLKVLKSASTQLIANDALELFLLINDSTTEDSTQTALKRFAKADFIKYQNRNQEALIAFQNILEDHPKASIVDISLYRIGQLFELTRDYNKALEHYQKIIDEHPESIYRDEAFFYSGQIYQKHLDQLEKAKTMYEALIFNHQDSIHFVEARKRYRQLRGDANI
jgi:tetratricopeptide (TPR) repeat protein